MAKTRRLTLDMGDKFDDLLTEQSRDADTTKADYIRRAVATYAFLRKRSRDSGKVTITTDGGEVADLVLP